MRSRWLADLVPAAAGAAVEGVWAGALAALVTGRSGAPALLSAAAAVFVAALVAARSGSGAEPSRRARAAVIALTLAVAALYYLAGRGWAGNLPVVAAVGAVLYAALLVVLGIALGREAISPDAALRRAVRAFALLCGLLAIGAVAGATPRWAAGAVVAALVAGALSVAVARAGSLARQAGAEERAPSWRWLLAVVGALLLVVAVGALVSLVLRVDVILWALAVAGELLQYLLRLLGFVLGWAGAGLLRALSWLLGLAHLHALPKVEPPQGGRPHIQALPKAPRGGAYAATRVAITVAAAAVAVVVPLLIVAFALRRVRGGTQEAVVEERETLLTLRAATGDAAGRLRRRLARLVPHRRPPASPAEQVRREYEGLERRLTRAGHARPAGVTVRDYLQGLPDGPPDVASADEPLAAELSRLYELARYSTHVVEGDAARRFGDLARAFPAPHQTRP